MNRREREDSTVDERSQDVDWLDDPFERAYTTAVLDADPIPPRERSARAAPSGGQPFALRGCVITPDERIDDGFVVVHGSTIVSVGAQPPDAGVVTIETGGVILPGLIDLHGHPEYNIFAAWEPPKLYHNRYQWRRSKEYGGRTVMDDARDKGLPLPKRARAG